MDYYTVEELKEKVESLSEEKILELDKINVTVNYPQASFKKELKNFVEVYDFVLKQHEGWKNKNTEELIPYFQTSVEFFQTVLQLFTDHINKDFKEDRKYIHYQFGGDDTFSDAIEMLKNSMYENKYIFIYNTPVLAFLVELFNRDDKDALKVIKYMAGGEFRSIKLHDFFLLQELYEFKRPENETIKRSETEKKSLLDIREELKQVINKGKERLENFHEDSHQKFQTWFSEEKREYNKWIVQTQNSFEEFDEESKQTIKDKEELYDKILQLKAPIKYWEERALNLRKEGQKWMYWLIGCSTVAIVLLTLVLYFISDGTLKEMFEKTGLAIRWSIVFITLISFLAYGIRTFTRLMFSTYHLARDAEERKQLTYVYLALKEDKNIDDKERHLVLQSLFSRSDSGLLKSDTSPTMPGNILEKLSK